MKKLTKRLIVFVLVVVLSVSMCAPTFAATEDSLAAVRYVISSRFDQKQAGDNDGYVSMIQMSLYGYSYATRECISGYGVDGQYGADTVRAVKLYQDAEGLDDDGVVGPNTWSFLAYDLARFDSNGWYSIYGIGTYRVVKVESLTDYAVDSDSVWGYYTQNHQNEVTHFRYEAQE